MRYKRYKIHGCCRKRIKQRVQEAAPEPSSEELSEESESVSQVDRNLLMNIEEQEEIKVEQTFLAPEQIVNIAVET